MHADIGATDAVENLRRLIRHHAYSANTAFTTSDAVVGDGRVASTEALAESILNAAAKTGAIALIEPGLWDALTDEVLDTDFMQAVNAIILRGESPHARAEAEPDEMTLAAPITEMKTQTVAQTSPKLEHPRMVGLLTAREAAKMLGCSERTLWMLTDENQIAAVKIGRSVRYDPRDLTRWIDANKTTSCDHSPPTAIRTV